MTNSAPNTSTLWQALTAHQRELAQHHLRDLVREPQRAERFSLTIADLTLDFSKNHLTTTTLDLLCQLAESRQLTEQIERLFNGECVNATEQRPALHTALRARSSQAVSVNGHDIMSGIRQTLDKMKELVRQIRERQWLGYNQQPITDIVNIGIGGSDLGPRLALEALPSYQNSHLRCHFIANVDGHVIEQTLKNLNPATTVFIISSKSFATLETLTNARTALNWLQQATDNPTAHANHFLAITGQPDKAKQFGIPAENIFLIPEWIGGRYSLWSAIGLPVALAIGMENFQELLNGAYAMDEHFRHQPFNKNMPVILGLINVWYNNFFATRARALLPYTELLKTLPLYLQQLEMESTGKSVAHDGQTLDYPTGQIIFGAAGTIGQHTFYQMLHQGTQLIPADFIVPLQGNSTLEHHHAILVASALGHSKVLAEGFTLAEAQQELQQRALPATTIASIAPHKVLPGNRPSNMLSFAKLTPFTLGALLALYEHKVFVQSVIWQINPFDQWGVETGKRMAAGILPTLDLTINAE